LGLAILAALASTRTDHLGADGAGDAAALVGGFHLAWGVAAGFVLAALAVVVIALPDPRRCADAGTENPAPAGA
jgi:hypothetical protein